MEILGKITAFLFIAALIFWGLAKVLAIFLIFAKYTVIAAGIFLIITIGANIFTN